MQKGGEAKAQSDFVQTAFDAGSVGFDSNPQNR
jgi:hypothetical protein